MKRNTTGIMESLAILRTVENGVEEFTTQLADTGKAKEYQKGWQQIVVLGDKFKETHEDKENVFRAAYGVNASYGIRKVNNLLRQLAEWIDEFCVDEKTEKSGFKDIIRVKLYNSKGEKEKRNGALDSTLGKAKHLDDFTTHYLTTKTYIDQYYFGCQSEKPRELQAILDKVEEEASKLYLSIVFKSTIEKLSYLKNRQKEVPSNIIVNLQYQFSILPKEPTTLISIQVLAIKFLLKPNLETFNDFKLAYLNKFKNLQSEQKPYLLTLINSLTIVRPPVENIMKEYLFLYEFGIQNKIFVDELFIEREFFDNIAFVIKSAGTPSLMENFIKTHGHYIKEEQGQEQCIKLANCYLFCMKGNFFRALKELNFIKSIYPLFNLRMQILGFICNIETTRDKQETYNFIKEKEDGFRKLLIAYSKKGYINEDERRSYLNFLAFAKKILTIQNADNPAVELSALLDSFEGIITEKTWIEKKITETS